MSDDQRHQHQIHALCSGCDGEGSTLVPTAAVVGGSPQTIVMTRPCRWCRGTGRRPFAAPM